MTNKPKDEPKIVPTDDPVDGLWQLSSFCFLSESDQRRLAKLIQDADNFREQAIQELEEGFAEAKTISNLPNPVPKRNIHESGKVHEEAINHYAVQAYANISTEVKTRWQACCTALDRIADLIEKQHEMREFIAEADAKKPGLEAKQAWRIARALPVRARHGLDVLHGRMEEFCTLKLRNTHKNETAVLLEASALMLRIANAEKRCSEQVADGSFQWNKQQYELISDFASRVTQLLARSEGKLEFNFGQIPEFDPMHSEYRDGVRGTRGQG